VDPNRSFDAQTFIPQIAGQRLGQIRVFGGENPPTALEHGDPGSESREHLSDLQGDIAPTQHDH
jgi:hypothetical protein